MVAFAQGVMLIGSTPPWQNLLVGASATHRIVLVLDNAG